MKPYKRVRIVIVVRDIPRKDADFLVLLTQKPFPLWYNVPKFPSTGSIFQYIPFATN